MAGENRLGHQAYITKTGQRVHKLFELINYVAEQNSMRISTSVLNQVINEAIAIVQPPTDKGKRLKIFYGTQASTRPPTFVIFVNDKELFHFSYERYLVNQIRKEFGLEGTPVRIIVREKLEKEVQRSKGILSNKGFLEKAPESKINDEKDKLIKYTKMLEDIKARIASMQ